MGKKIDGSSIFDIDDLKAKANQFIDVIDKMSDQFKSRIKELQDEAKNIQFEAGNAKASNAELKKLADQIKVLNDNIESLGKTLSKKQATRL